jgi:rod shape-determining protein MreD
MTTPVLQWLDNAARHVAPGAVTLFTVMIGVVPTDIPYLGLVAPALPLTAIFYWVVHRPDLMPRLLVFLVGLFEDVLTAAPIGLHALLFLLLHAGVLAERRFLLGKPFPVVWLGFAAAMLAISAAEWLLVSLYLLWPAAVGALLVHALLTISLFPAIAWVYIQIHRGFLSAD